jgi:tryptophan 2,3-dioxygenase
MFIVLHQVYELWFKLLIAELVAVRDHLFDGRTTAARHLLARVNTIVRLMTEHLALADTMIFCVFAAFRGKLGSASGIESKQFREIERVSGDGRGRPGGRTSATVWDGFCALLERHGLRMPPDDPERRAQSLARLAREGDRRPDLLAVAEDLIAYDESFRAWRCRHALMVERQIGSRRGTGGTSGVTYLESTFDKRFYPELWALRTA